MSRMFKLSLTFIFGIIITLITMSTVKSGWHHALIINGVMTVAYVLFSQIKNELRLPVALLTFVGTTGLAGLVYLSDKIPQIVCWALLVQVVVLTPLMGFPIKEIKDEGRGI